jgi:DNA-binding PadR family transcriptional regulator
MLAGDRLSSAWLDRVLLGLLALRETYGYEMSAAVQRAAESEFGARAGDAYLPEGAVYPALRRLERGGILCGHWVDVGEGVPRRRYYALTPKGHRVAAALAQRGQARVVPTRSAPTAARP